MQSLADWFITLEPPSEPFYLEAHQHVVDPVEFFHSLRKDIQGGPGGARARLGTLQTDLRKLKGGDDGSRNR